MANENRVFNLPADPTPDSSGVGTVLFQQFEDLRKQKLAQENQAVTENLRHRHRAAEIDQEGRLNRMLETLQHGNRIAKADQEWTRSQVAARQALEATLGLAEEAAVSGIPNPLASVETPEAPGEAPIVRRRTGLGPGAAPVAQDVLMQSLREHAGRTQALAQGEAVQATARLKDELDTLPSNVTTRIRAAIETARTRGDTLTELMLAPYAEPGASARGLERIIPAIARLEAASAHDKTLIALSEEATSRAKQVAEIRASIDRLKTRASAGKVNIAVYDKAAVQIRTHLAESRRRMDQLNETMLFATDEGTMRRARQLYNREEQMYQELSAQMVALENLQQQVARGAAFTEGQPREPGSSSPVLTEPPAPLPSGGGDPLGVRPRGRP